MSNRQTSRDELEALLKRADDTRREAEDAIERARRSLHRRPSYPEQGHTFGPPGNPPDNDQAA